MLTAKAASSTSRKQGDKSLTEHHLAEMSICCRLPSNVLLTALRD